MKLKGIGYVYIVVMVVLLVIIGASLQMEFRTSKLLPLIISGIAFVLAAMGLGRELLAKPEPKTSHAPDDKSGEGKRREGWRGYLVNLAWVMGFLVGIYVLGFIIAIPLFVLAYMRWLGTSWRTTIIFAILTPAFFYGVFELALKIQLYRGLLFDWLGY